MLDRLHRLATGRNVLILLALELIMMMGVMPYMGRRLAAVTGGAGPLDLVIPTYSPRLAHDMMAAYGEEGRALYRSIELGADIAYPLIYGLAFALLLAYIWPRVAPEIRWVRWLPLIPLVGMLFDLGENFAVVGLLARFPDQVDGLARLAGFCSLMKWSFVFLAFGLILIGANGLLLRRLRRR